ncbi:MAG: PadR family transcriptional regulator [Acidobacteriota bacterium]
MSEQIPLLKGTLDLLILKALSVQPTHGYGLSVWLEERSQQQITPEDSAIYQALRRMEARRLVAADWGLTENNRRARYYSLTPRGVEYLHQEAGTWLRYTRWVTTLLEADGGLPSLETV